MNYKPYLNKFLLFSSLILLMISISSSVSAADDLGDRSYRTYANGPNLPEQTISLPAYEGTSTVFYHDASQIRLNRSELDTVVNYFDTAMSLYRAYGKLPSYPQPNAGGITDPADKGSVILRASAEGAFAAGLGLNGKAEVFKAWFNEDNFNQIPLDIRTWELAYYELGRGAYFAIYDYFIFDNGSQDMPSAFPRLITYTTIEDLGINHLLDNTGRWRNNIGINPYAMNERLQPLLAQNSFSDFYEEVADPDNPGTTHASGFIEADLNNNGLIEGNERIGLNDGQATALYFLRNVYGKSFMRTFFEYAADNAVNQQPASGEAALCNIVRAGNEALSQTSGIPTSDNRVGEYLIEQFKFPVCKSNRPRVRQASFDGTWFYLEWDIVDDTSTYTQFVIGDNSSGRKSLYRDSPGATDRGNYVYQYYHRNDICEAFGPGRFDLSAQIWPDSDSSRAEDATVISGTPTIVCRPETPIIRDASFDGTWFYLEWDIAEDADRYTQFVIGNNTNGQKSLYSLNEGATDRGDYVYQYYHINDICAAFGLGEFRLSAQVWTNEDNSKAETIGVVDGLQSVLCQ